MKLFALAILSVFANFASAEIAQVQTAIMPGVGKVTAVATRTESVDSFDVEVYVTCYSYSKGKRFERPQIDYGKINNDIKEHICGLTSTSYTPLKDPDGIFVGFVILKNSAGASHCDEDAKKSVLIPIRELCAK
jgi:hypothetical protein